MSDTHRLLSFGIPIAIVDLALGIAVGWWLRGTALPYVARVQHARQAMEALRRLHELTRDVAGRVGQHLQRVEAISRGLNRVGGSGDGGRDHTVVDAVSRIVEANDELTSKLAAAQLQLHEQAATIEAQAAAAMADLLTGLPNRRAFDQELARTFAQWQHQSAPLSIVLVDVDQLQQLREGQGQQAADDVLRQVAGVLSDTVRTMDLVARYADNQFAVMLPGTDSAQARLAAERLRAAVAEHEFLDGGMPLSITVSEGVADALPGDDLKSLLKRTQTALEASQKLGRNCAHLHDGSGCEPITKAASGADEFDLDSTDLLNLAKNFKLISVNAQSDPLTGLANRRGFFEGLRQQLAAHNLSDEPLSLVLFDVDHLAQHNKTYGQLVGDVVLRVLTQIVRSGTRTQRDLAARYDGGTLAVVLNGTPLEDALIVAERVRRAVAGCKLRADGNELTVTVSSGVAQAARGVDCVALIKAAETALKKAKAGGRNATYFHDGRQAQSAATPALSVVSSS